MARAMITRPMKPPAALTIHLHRAAPPKPSEGEPCNGCGVCCALELCPPGIVRHLRRQGPWPSLRWDAAATRYVCGLLADRRGWSARVVGRWIAAGEGCDCGVEVGEL